MAKFKILQKDPSKLKNKILKFWDKYLPGTSSERFDWLKSNPEGNTVWFFAFEEGSDELAGAISIMRHNILLNGDLVHAGIVGDFMVSEKYRVFGPAIPLQEAVIESKNSLNLDILYTVPNSSSLQVMLRVGYVDKVKMCNMVRPVRTEPYILNFIKIKYIKNVVCQALDNILRVLPVGVFLSANDHFQLVDTVDASFDDFCINTKLVSSELQSNSSYEYMNWRYCQSPISGFQFLKYIDKKTSELQGFIVFSTNKNKIMIYDIKAKENKYFDKLLKKVLQIAYKEKNNAVCIKLSYSDPLISTLKRFFFLNSRDDFSVLVVEGDTDYNYDDWLVMERDRNI